MTIMLSRIVLFCGVLLLAQAHAADAPPRWPNPGDDFEVREAMIPMRDGIKLHTVIIAPRKIDAPAPILLQRTPYDAAKRISAPLRTQLPAILGPGSAQLDGYIWVYQDIRGRNGSEGKFLMERAARGPFNATNTDETTDAWDTVDWLIKNIPGNNGRVGLYGTSYDGWTVLMALLDPHPAVRAAVPVNPVADMWMGDDWFHNGAFRMPYAFEYVYQMETDKNARTPFAFDHEDSYVWWLRAGSAAEVGKRYLNDERYDYWRDLTGHPDYDAFWQAAAFDKLLAKNATRLVPTMHIQGLFDQEDLYGALAAYEALEPRDTANNLNYFVAGPWRHGQNWADGSSLAGMHWDQDTALQWRRDQLAPFFEHYLKDGPDPHLAPVTVFNTGTRQWEHFDRWPQPQGVSTRHLYLRNGGNVGWEAPAKADKSADHYVSDPAKPVPYQPRPVRRIYDDEVGYAAWRSWLAMDQRFVDGRPDVLTYVSEPLDQPVTVRGNVTAHLFAQTTGSDADWVVTLIHVFPHQEAAEPTMSGYELMISGNILRGRYRASPSQPQPLTPNRTLAYTIPMPQVNHTFKRHHRLMVQIQSTWFPLYDRNPQTFVPSIMDAKVTDYHPATQTILHGSADPTNLELQVSDH
jgi:putative CocE/NonD family hydrolase